jgi:signal transduction histidine kinase
LADDLAGSPRLAEIVCEMRHSIARLGQPMEGLLSFARPTRARRCNLDVNGALESVLFLVGQQRTAARVSVERRLAADLPPVHGDRAQLEQVFLNVCLNACQAMSGGGTLTVRSFARDGVVVLQFADTGPGIPPEARPHIFTPFFTTRRDGNGLGLAIAARIVVEHGGEILFDCPPEGGTVFSLMLPAASAEGKAA